MRTTPMNTPFANALTKSLPVIPSTTPDRKQIPASTVDPPRITCASLRTPSAVFMMNSLSCGPSPSHPYASHLDRLFPRRLRLELGPVPLDQVSQHRRYARASTVRQRARKGSAPQ